MPPGSSRKSSVNDHHAVRSGIDQSATLISTLFLVAVVTTVVSADLTFGMDQGAPDRGVCEACAAAAAALRQRVLGVDGDGWG